MEPASSHRISSEDGGCEGSLSSHGAHEGSGEEEQEGGEVELEGEEEEEEEREVDQEQVPRENAFLQHAKSGPHWEAMDEREKLRKMCAIWVAVWLP